MRRKLTDRRKRARRHAVSFATPTHLLDSYDALHRVIGAWLRGYEAALRDVRKDKKR